ncbi:hypothetical protein D3X12_14120 [Pseudomonas protegens]|uniref:Uncharacterized protein n=1 Tax=Pseudomonas protegens TaxID=380021 RepID=A0ABY2VGQ3_9PSED|nr:hypothetical protein CEP86_32390 [Pseudomonas protegens]PNV99437.1 hypothetical protein C1633_06575 [Pseudomonas protegens]POA91810.1 hypothetical protein C1883_01855 [Pseudomonas protegens]QEZ51767.1 hypothetical protein D3X12_14120 [Pseudomonas protegens]QEZ56159.1 hypothetical protein D4N38_05355 [Pseudomonas protegens]
MRCSRRRKAESIPVGTSLLAMAVSDNAQPLIRWGARARIASKLAPALSGEPRPVKLPSP